MSNYENELQRFFCDVGANDAHERDRARAAFDGTLRAAHARLADSVDECYWALDDAFPSFFRFLRWLNLRLTRQASSPNADR